MSPTYLAQWVIPAAYSLLPRAMASPRATALLVAIALQESGLRARRQYGSGPARGLLQFERGTPATRGGVTGVLLHDRVGPIARAVCRALIVDPEPAAVYVAIEHQDVLAAAFGRLLLWTLPDALPGPPDVSDAWGQYLRAWRPGKPHVGTWAGHYATAWAEVEPT